MVRVVTFTGHGNVTDPAQRGSPRYAPLVSTATRIDADAFLSGDWPRGSELVDGEVVMTDPDASTASWPGSAAPAAGPTFWHQELVGRIFEALRAWIRAGQGRGHAGQGGNWVLADGHVYKPDVWWVAQERRFDLTAARHDGPPDLAVEVRSPGTWALDIGPKRGIYEASGLAELWLVDVPAESVLVSRRSGAGSGFDLAVDVLPDDVLGSPALEGFALGLDELFAPA